MYAKLESKFGELVCLINDDAQIEGLWFVGQKYFPSIEEDALWLDEIEGASDEIIEVYESLRVQLEAYEKGELKSFDLPLNLKGTEFRITVWKELLKIAYGETTSYGELGKRVAKVLHKKSMAGQAIGGAVGHNPFSIIVPCHRVLGKKGELTGYAGGLDKKTALLKHEGYPIQESLF